MYKVKNNLSPTLMKSIFPEREIPYNLRNLKPFQSSNVNTVFMAPKPLVTEDQRSGGNIPDDIKNFASLSEFKSKIKNWEHEGCTCRLCKVFIKDLGFI